jgi:leucyl aminopeptidase
MDFRTQASSPNAVSSTSADALLVIVAGDRPPAQLDATLSALLKDAIKQGDFELKAGRSLYLHRPAGVKAGRLVFVASDKTTPKAVRAAVASGLTQLKNRGAAHLAVALFGFEALNEAVAESVVLAASDATYLYTHTKPSAKKTLSLGKLTLLCDQLEVKALKAGLARGQAIAAGVELAKETANRPGNHCTPSYLASQARALGKTYGMKVDVLDRKAVEKLGMGAFLAVAQGSDEPLKFIVAQYNGAAKTKAPVVLVGKGITFDSGGISLKPGAEMDEMKFDMGGAASVLGTLRALGELKPKINVVFIIAACENMPSGRAVKPGDVVTSMSGQTIEILNTDAEGRLILCDALTYAERFKPAVVVDIATLTGACVIALGKVRSGMYASDDELAAALDAAGHAAQDTCWRMPLDEEYDEGLKSNFADVPNIAGRPGGSITAAMFLKHFTSKYRWGHLDIAGTAWNSGTNKGATGRPVGLLTHFVLSQVG